VKSNRGFTVIELVLALSLGAMILLLLFRAFMVAVAAQQDTQREIAGQQHARVTLQWIVTTIQAASEARGGTSATLELSGTFDLERGVECRGFLLGRIGEARTTLLYERRRTACPDNANSTGGELVVVSDPTVSITLLRFRYLDAASKPVSDLRQARMIETPLGVDSDRDGRPDSLLVQLAGLRARP